MGASRQDDWQQLAMESMILGMEASSVMWLRSLRLLTGGAIAEREAERMVAEKVEAFWTLWPALMHGGLQMGLHEAGMRTLAHYRKPVRANRRRLAR
jgi:hypothetical protein